MFVDMHHRDAVASSSAPSMSYSTETPPGPPYAPMFAALGGRPTVGLDVPITAVYMALFLGAAVGHMTIFQRNRRAGHKFILSGLMFGFCMARTATCVLRIVWANYPTDVSIAIAASIFVVAGVVLLFVINVIFTQRLVRAKHPAFGWSKGFSIACKVIYVLIVLLLIMIITVTVLSYFTLNPHTHVIARDIQLLGSTYYMTVAFLPIPLTLTALVIPPKQDLDHFGWGRWRTKVRVLLTGATLLCLGAAFRCGTAYKNPRPISDPAWYQSKACFYIFDLGVEIITIWLYLLARVDKRFHVPNRSRPLQSYEATAAANRAAADDAEAYAEIAETRPPMSPVSRDSTEHPSEKAYDVGDEEDEKEKEHV